MRLDPDECRARFTSSPVARLATVGADYRPHLVPMVFAVVDECVVMAVDHKPKTTRNLQRLRNVVANPSVCVLVDRYADDWSQLWWVRADAEAEVVSSGHQLRMGIEALVAKYEQYQSHTPRGPVLSARVTRWSGWAFSPEG